MKRLYKIVLFASVIALAASCDVSNIGTLYEGAAEDTGLSFTSSVFSDSEIPASQKTVSLELARRVADQALTVDVSTVIKKKVGSKETIVLSEQGSASFAAGEYKTVVTVDISALAVGVSYYGSVSLSNDELFDSRSSVSAVNLKLAKAYTWKSLGKGEFSDGLALQPSDDYLGIVKVEILQAEGFDRWRVLTPFPKSQLVTAWGEEYYCGNESTMIEFYKPDSSSNEIKFDQVIKTGLYMPDKGENAYIWYYYPSSYNAAYAPYDSNNCFVMQGVVQFFTVRMIENTTSWFGAGAQYLAFPGIDLASLFE